MLSFESDYIEGAHEKILQRLVETNLEKLSGYGNDPYTLSAKEKIKNACNCPQGEVFFLVGGTQTNALVISSMLKPYEGVIAAETGHINVHEAGAIEFTGHKVLSLPQEEGKISSKDLENYLKNFWENPTYEHMVFPGMVYISHPSEYGSLYSKKELKALYQICQSYQLPLFIDGARLGYGLMSPNSDLSLPSIAQYCDVFYIGGTKVGALCGEAVVFPKGNGPKHFLTMMKQQGALLAKGRLLGLQFDTLFTDNLYFDISAHTIKMAMLLKEGFQNRGYSLFLNSPTNQQFIIISNQKMEELSKNVAFEFWEKYDDSHSVVRFVTSWATEKKDILALFSLLD